MFTLRNNKGFTLIELLAVMAIVAVLAGIVSTQVSGSGDTSKDVQTKQDATTVETAVADYFSDQNGASIVGSSPVTVFDEDRIITSTNNKWPEITITSSSAYGQVFQENRSQIAAVALFDEEGNPSVLSIRGLIQAYNAVDFDALIEGGYLQAPPEGAGKFTKTFNDFLWLLKKETAAGGGGTVDSREVEVFKLVTIQEVEGSEVDVLAYQRLVGETIENDLPIAIAPQFLATGDLQPLDITLDGFDPEGEELFFNVMSQPSLGTLSGIPPNLVYTPNEIVTGDDSFTFKVNDGISDSAIETVSVKLGSGSAGESGPTFTDVAPSNKIDDPLDIEIFLFPSSSFNVVVTFTGSFMDQSLVIDPKTGFDVVDEALLESLIGALDVELIGASLTAVFPAINAVSMTLTGSQIDTLAEAQANVAGDPEPVIRIEEDTVIILP